jgi:ABC-type branched-subunit amino acid transport system ATPase component
MTICAAVANSHMGRQQLLSMAMAFVSMPEILLLDEPRPDCRTTAAEVFSVVRATGQSHSLTLRIAEQDSGG